MPEEKMEAAQAAAPQDQPQKEQAQETAAKQADLKNDDLGGGGEEKNAASAKTPDGGQKTGGGNDKTDPDKKQTPEQKDPYGQFAVPEGIVVAEEPMRRFKELARELNLPKDAAQKLVDLQTGMAAAQVQEFRAVQEKWKEEVEKEYGAGKAAVLSRAAKAMDAYGGTELREALDEMGLGNHPALVRAFAKIGETISEDKLVSSKTQGGGDKTLAEALYGTNK